MMYLDTTLDSPQATGPFHAAGGESHRPKHFAPEQVDVELREASPGCADHYDQLNGLILRADRYFDAEAKLGAELSRRHSIAGADENLIARYRLESDDCYPRLLAALDSLRGDAAAAPVTTRREQSFGDRDSVLIRTTLAFFVDRAVATLAAVNDGLDLSDNVFALLADMRVARELLEWTFSTAGHHDEVPA